MKLVILAGGKGTRMGAMTEFIPKPMVPLMRKPILEHQIHFAKKYGFDDIIISTGYMGDVIRDYFKDGKEWGVHIQYSPDPFPLGTAGAVKHLEQELKDNFVLFYGDTIMDIDLNSLVQLHVKKESMATISVWIAPSVKGRLYLVTIIPVKIICVLQNNAPKITKVSPSLTVAS